MPGLSEAFEGHILDAVEEARQARKRQLEAEFDAIIADEVPETESRNTGHVLAGLGHSVDLLEKTNTQPIPISSTESSEGEK